MDCVLKITQFKNVALRQTNILLVTSRESLIIHKK